MKQILLLTFKLRFPTENLAHTAKQMERVFHLEYLFHEMKQYTK